MTSWRRPRSPRPRSVSGFGLRPLSAGLTLLAADWCAVFACLAAIWWLRDGPLRQLLPSLGPVAPLSQLVVRLYGLAPWTLAFAASRLYTRRTLFWDETRRVVYACTLAALFAVAVSFAEKRATTTSRLVIGGLWLTTIVVVPLVRLQAKRLLAALGLWRKRVLIVGAGETGMQVLEKIRQNAELGYVPVAFVDDDPTKIGTQQAGLPVRGPLGSVSRAIADLDIEDVVVAIPELPRGRLLHLIALCEGQVQSIRLVPDLFGLASVGVEAEDLDGVLLLHMRWNLAKPWNLLVKRLFDLSVAIGFAVLLAPVLIATAIAIRVDSPGPIFFVQERLGRGRRRFACVKFRTMHADNEARLQVHLAGDHGASAEWKEFAKLKSLDPRVTRVGRFLRRSSLDELPQLINVMRRDMSLVGPRPYLPSETERMGDLAETILKAPPGVTGLWQVSGRNHLSFEQRIRLDEYYVRNWSLWMDVVVLLKTVGAVLRGDGAY
ncbi:MAG: undecaprenyl-phosphate galactose phosphotransferase WbaP [bacterium]